MRRGILLVFFSAAVMAVALTASSAEARGFRGLHFWRAVRPSCCVSVERAVGGDTVQARELVPSYEPLRQPWYNARLDDEELAYGED